MSRGLRAVDWEAELAVVIGSGGKHVSRRTRYDHVAGYALFNDVWIRDWQIKKPPMLAADFRRGRLAQRCRPFAEPDLGSLIT